MTRPRCRPSPAGHLLDVDIGIRIVEMIYPGSRVLHEEMTGIHLDSAGWQKTDGTSVHRSRRRAGEINSFRIVFAPMAGAVEHVLLRQPVRRATQVGAPRKNDK